MCDICFPTKYKPNQIVIDNGNGDWGTVSINNISFPYSVKEHEIFNNDPDPIIRFKFLNIIWIAPLVSVGRAISWGVIDTLYLLACITYKNYHDLGTPETLIKVKQSLKNGLTALKHGALLVCMAALGIFAPMRAKRNFAKLERDLIQQVKKGQNIFHYTFAPCMQPVDISKAMPTIEFSGEVSEGGKIFVPIPTNTYLVDSFRYFQRQLRENPEIDETNCENIQPFIIDNVSIEFNWHLYQISRIVHYR